MLISLFVLIIFVSSYKFIFADEETTLTNKKGVAYTLPSKFGNMTTTSCSGAPSCGTNMASYNGIYAKSNGADQCTGNSCGAYSTYGYQYQCVEYAQRYFGQLYGTTPIWYANAKDMCSTHPSNVAKTSSPKAGDLVVFGWGTYGHVAVISGFTSSSVNVVEQNSSPTGKNTYAKSDVECYLTYTGSGGGNCKNLGYYCGNDGLGLDANNLYYCSGSGAKPALSSDCKFTCVIMPSGQDDKCSSSGSCSSVNTGYYCGSDKIGGDPNTLYYCVNSAPKVI